MRLGSASGVTHPPASLLGLSTQMSPRGGSLPGSCVPLSWGWGCARGEQVPVGTQLSPAWGPPSEHGLPQHPSTQPVMGGALTHLEQAQGSPCRIRSPRWPEDVQEGHLKTLQRLVVQAQGWQIPPPRDTAALTARSCWGTCAAGDSIVALSSSGDAANGLRAEASASGHRFAAPSMRGMCHMHRFLSDTRDSLWPGHHPERPQRGHLCLWSWGQKEGALKWEEEEKAA